MALIDRATFGELKQMSGEVFINELIDTFLDDAPKMMQDITMALNANDADSFRRAAHSMKSNAATFGANQLADLAKELESLGRENRLSEVGDNVRSLEEAAKSACDELKGLKA